VRVERKSGRKKQRGHQAGGNAAVGVEAAEHLTPSITTCAKLQLCDSLFCF
jgi:hypothetical protein